MKLKNAPKIRVISQYPRVKNKYDIPKIAATANIKSSIVKKMPQAPAIE